MPVNVGIYTCRYPLLSETQTLALTMHSRPLQLKKNLLNRKLSVTKAIGCLLLILSACALSVQVMAVGTPQVMPNAANGVGMYIGNGTISGPYLNAPAQNRIRFYITNAAVENLYFNVRAYDRNTNAQIPLYYRILNAASTVIVAPAQITTGQQIGTYARAVAGPNISGLVPAGYTPLSFDPAANGEYYIELYESSDGGATATTNQLVLVTLFDFTIATSANVKSIGRIYSQAWSFLTYDPATNVGSINFPLEGDFFGYTADSTIVRLDLQAGFRPLGFILYMNKEGAVNGSNWANDRRSQNTGATAPSLPGYPVFLAAPDAAVFPIAATATAPQFSGKIYGCAPNLYIPYYIDKPGDVAILLDLNGTTGYQAGTSDRYLYFYDIPVGHNVATWNGLNGLGAIVTTSAAIDMTLSLRRGRVNIPMYDAELNSNGLSVTGVSPMATVPRLYFDDALLANTASTQCLSAADGNNNNTGVGITNADIGVASPGRAWDGPGSGNALPAPAGGGGSTTTVTCDDYGNVRTLNTWFWAYEASSAVYVLAMPTCSADGDAIPYTTDIDDDNDGIIDITEGGGTDPFADADADGTPNFLDTTPGGAVPAFVDTNNDGVNDNYDADLDGIVNSFDLDSDNDGIPDLIEAGGVDVNGNGHVDVLMDANGNGLADVYETAQGGHTLANRDTDGDGIPNERDLDSDNDGIPDILEAGGADTNNDGKVDVFADPENDGFASAYDPDDNNDGTNENPLESLILTGADTTNDGIANSYTRGDFDKDSHANPYDLDADGDGILDVREAGLPDATNDGLTDGPFGPDGWSDVVDALAAPLALPNTDASGNPNYLDIDSDNDGITDNIEGQPTATYTFPTGLDSDADGIDDAYDNNDGAFAGFANNGIIPWNHAGSVDALPDYIDTDTDDDGVLDIVEAHDYNMNNKPDDLVTLTGVDSDGDGLDDRFDLVTGPNVTEEGMLANGAVGNPATPGARGPLQKAAPTNVDRQWRNVLSALPIRLLSFTAQKQSGNTIQIGWIAENEVDFKEYVLERSTDGTSFSAIATIAGKGGNRSVYTCTDNLGSLPATKLYYRLIPIDIDGRFTYSRILFVTLDPVNGITMLVTPNPASTNVALKITSDKQRTVLVNIIDNQGRILSAQRISITNGNNIITLTDASRLISGIYTVLVSTGEEKLSAKLVIQR
jgi:hypothetical protein